MVRSITASKGSRRFKIGCQRCRIRHLKCDQGTPTCSRCKSSGSECVRSYNYKFHHCTFPEDQEWPTPPREITYVDETQAVAANYETVSDLEHENTPSGLKSTDLLSSASSQRVPGEPKVPPDPSSASIISSAMPNGSAGSICHESESQDQPISRAEPYGPNQRGSGMVILPANTHFSSLPSEKGRRMSTDGDDSLTYEYNELPSVTKHQIYLERPVWPLTNPYEARLLRHYVQNLSIWLDLCDEKRHFQVDVAHRAGTCPILLNAIFALSSRHLSDTADYDPYASNRYHQECLKHLIPMLNDSATISDESLFAATIILRVLEEMDVRTEGTDTQGHMLGIQLFVGAINPNSQGLRGSLSEAAFWVGLRQEIYIAVLNSTSVKLNLEHCLVEHYLIKPTNDCGWANRAITHCAEVLNFCFGDSKASPGLWEKLRRYNEDWQDSKPASFTPVYYRGPDYGRGEVFPEIWYHETCHIIGVQHYLLAHTLLALFDPEIPRVGAARKTGVRLMKEQVKTDIRKLCGIGLYNRWTPPGMFTACMGIAICGDRFADRMDQDALLGILTKTEADHGRPTKTIQKQMMKCWGRPFED